MLLNKRGGILQIFLISKKIIYHRPIWLDRAVDERGANPPTHPTTTTSWIKNPSRGRLKISLRPLAVWTSENILKFFISLGIFENSTIFQLFYTSIYIELKRWNFPNNLECKGTIVAKFLIRNHSTPLPPYQIKSYYVYGEKIFLRRYIEIYRHLQCKCFFWYQTETFVLENF